MEVNKYNLDAITNEYVNDCVSNFRMDLLHEAYLISIKSKDKNITQHTVDEALFRIRKNENSTTRRVDYKYKKLASYGVLIGLLYTLCGCIIFVVQNTAFRPEKDLGQMVMVIGLSVSVIFSAWNILINKARQMSLSDSSVRSQHQYLVIHKWIKIESLVNSFTPIEVSTIQNLLPKLQDICKGVVSADDISTVLYVRNKILHENGKVSDLEVEMAVRIENLIISKLQQVVIKENDKTDAK